MHLIKSRFLVRGEVWSDQEPAPARVDWIFYRQRSQPVPGASWKFFYTVVLDLNQHPDSLLWKMNKTTANNIRRAHDKDGVVCESTRAVSRELLDRFEETYQRFAALKGLGPLDRPYLDQLAKDGALELSWAKDQKGNVLAYHAYYRNCHRSCLLHTVSLYQTLAESAARNAMSRANRYLFWCDMMRHRDQGLKVFDFGGWYPGDTDQGLLAINRFKEGFGGKVVREYNCEQILSLKGWVVLTAAGLLNWARGLAARLRGGRKGGEAAPSAVEEDVKSSNTPQPPLSPSNGE